VTRLRAWLLNGLLLLAGLALGLALTEGGVRLLSPQPTGLAFQDEYGLALHWPGLVRYLPQYRDTVSFNSAGMRDYEHPIQKPDGTFRILILGDSFMEAQQVPFEASLPNLVERGLQQRTGHRVEVINAGVSGWGTDDELRYLTSYGLKWRPDLVLVAMTLHNDISDNLREEWHTLRGGKLIEQAKPRTSFLRYQVVRLKAFLATRFQLYQLWRRVSHGREIRQTRNDLDTHIVQLFRDPTPEVIARGFELTDSLLGRIQAVTQAAGGKTALVLLPLKVQLSAPAFSAFVESAHATLQEMPPEKPQRTVTGMARRLGIPVIDLLPGFQRWTAESRTPIFLEEEGHWNATGHRLAAEAVVSGLVALWSQR
jgi:lysophospholipase L1-like esterase